MLLTALAASLAAFGPLAAAAAPPGGTWGPSQIPYAGGELCTDAAERAALVSWPTVDGALGLAAHTIRGPAAGSPGAYDQPATLPDTRTPVDAATVGTAGLSPAALAYLLNTAARSSDPVQVAGAAALAADDTPAACVDGGAAGLSTATVDTLASEAARRAGPYTVSLTADGPVTLGSAKVVTASVRSAGGAAVPGLTVHFASSAGDATLGAATALTDAAGHATTTVTVPSTATEATVPVHASVSAPVGLVEYSAAGDVPLLVAAEPVDATADAALHIDTTADPHVEVSVASPLVLPGGTVQAQVAVTGMHGHLGTASVQALGPLPFAKGTGCASYRSGFPADTHASPLAHDVRVVADSGFPVRIGPISNAGCYLVMADVATVNASPAAQASSGRADLRAVIGVAPVRLSVTAQGHGVAVAGPLTAHVAASGDTPATVAAAQGSVVGPRSASKGSCPATGWDSAGSAGTVRSGTTDSAGLPVTTSAVHADGCYHLQLTVRITLPGIGSLTTAASATTLVLAPQLAVTGLSHTSVLPGKSVQADVAVYGTLTQPGTLRLQLVRLPDATTGCFGSDYTDLRPFPLPVRAPTTDTRGDNQYRVSTPPVPEVGCWTVAPVLTLDANPAVQVIGAPVAGTNVALLAYTPAAVTGPGGAGAGIHDSLRLAITGAAVLLLIVVCCAVTVRLARRYAEDDDDPSDDGLAAELEDQPVEAGR